jgi:hypothetical protein
VSPPPPSEPEPLVTCDAFPVLCRIRPGRTGACDRYGNADGRLVRLDPVVLARRAATTGGEMVPFLSDGPWDGSILRDGETFVTGIGAGTTYPDYKPAPFIVSAEVEGIDTVTVVTEGIFSYPRRPSAGAGARPADRLARGQSLAACHGRGRPLGVAPVRHASASSR